MVALGLHVPEWLALRVELVKLATSCRAHYVGVMSTGNVLWCSNRIDDELADAFYLAEIAPRRFQMRRGIAIDLAVRLGPCACVARSFASIYVLLVLRRASASCGRDCIVCRYNRVWIIPIVEMAWRTHDQGHEPYDS